jgi:fructan beta-fructosidase
MKIEKEKYTPQLHFKPPFGWLNDPNGLMFANEQWHLFYQYYPMDNIWGPMHWGHAVSDNLVDWAHCPIALAPDESGNMFSGSGIIDKENVSGLFEQPSDNNLVVFYTSSLPRGEGLEDFQSQCLAYSTDGGIRWTKYENNPVIANPGLDCYRDPKVIWIEESKHWILLVTHGQSIGFYKSTNLIAWELVCEFGKKEGLHSKGPWECPDLFPLTAQDGTSKWVLVAGIGDGCAAPGSGTQYFVGEFDGETFVNDNAPETVLYLDNGRDYYATQSWFNAPDNKRIGISWMSNWRYARDTETKTYRSIMSLPKEYSLQKNSAGQYVVAQKFADLVNEAFAPASLINKDDFASIEIVNPVYKLSGELSIAEDSKVDITLFNEQRAQITITAKEGELVISSCREYSGSNNVMHKEFPHDYQFKHPYNPEKVTFELIVDNGAVELQLADGQISMTQLYFPKELNGNLSLSGQGWSQVALATLSHKFK